MTNERELEQRSGRPIDDRYWWLAELALWAGLAAALTYLANWRYAIFRDSIDLGIFTQVVNSAFDHFSLTTVFTGFSSPVEAGWNHLLVHWSPLIVVGWPFVRLFGPVGLEYLQALLVAATLVPLWALARTRFSPGWTFAMTCVCALYPILWANGFGDFHEMAFVPLLSAALVYAIDRRRIALGVLVAVLLACVKEDQFVVLAWTGGVLVVMWWSDLRLRRLGIALIAIAAAGAVLFFGILHGLLNPGRTYFSLHFYDWSSSAALWRHLPSAILMPRLLYALEILAPLAFLPLVSRYAVFLIPGFAEIALAREPVTLVPGAHYSALLSGYALAAFVCGVDVVRRRHPRLSYALVACAAAVAIVVGVFANPMASWYYLYRRPDAHDALLDRTLMRLPPQAHVGAEGPIFSHLGLDPNASEGFLRQEWFVYDTTDYSAQWADVDRAVVERLIRRKVYAIVSARDGIVVVRRTAAPAGV